MTLCESKKNVSYITKKGRQSILFFIINSRRKIDVMTVHQGKSFLSRCSVFLPVNFEFLDLLMTMFFGRAIVHVLYNKPLVFIVKF